MNAAGIAVRAIDRFGFQLLRQAGGALPGGNVALSPLGVAMSLGMLANGAGGLTLEEILSTLGVERGALEAFHHGMEELQATLGETRRDVALELANSVWTREEIPVEESFFQANRDFYNAEVLSFSTRDGVEAMNRWVAGKTHGRIPTMVSRLDPSAVMFLLDALYFQGKWKDPLDPDYTTRGWFHTARGESVPVDLMLASGKFPVRETARFQLVELPYADGQVVMDLVLPREGVELSALVSALGSSAGLGLDAKVSRETLVWLPRFEIAYESSLSGMLQALGMKAAFSGAADFSRISPSAPLRLGDVVHKTVLKVNEEGAEASSATLTEMRLLAYVPPVKIRLDRPFLFLIRDIPSGAVLFLGTVESPLPAS